MLCACITSHYHHMHQILILDLIVWFRDAASAANYCVLPLLSTGIFTLGYACSLTKSLTQELRLSKSELMNSNNLTN